MKAPSEWPPLVAGMFAGIKTRMALELNLKKVLLRLSPFPGSDQGFVKDWPPSVV